MICKENGLLSPRALFRGIPARVDFAPENMQKNASHVAEHSALENRNCMEAMCSPETTSQRFLEISDSHWRQINVVISRHHWKIFNKANFSRLSMTEDRCDSALTRTDPRPVVRPAEGPNSFHWKNVKLEVLSCCTKFHEPHVVSEYVHF